MCGKLYTPRQRSANVPFLITIGILHNIMHLKHIIQNTYPRDDDVICICIFIYFLGDILPMCIQFVQHKSIINALQCDRLVYVFIFIIFLFFFFFTVISFLLFNRCCCCYFYYIIVDFFVKSLFLNSLY